MKIRRASRRERKQRNKLKSRQASVPAIWLICPI